MKTQLLLLENILARFTYNTIRQRAILEAIHFLYNIAKIVARDYKVAVFTLASLDGINMIPAARDIP